MRINRIIILKIISMVLIIEGLAMVPAMIVGLYFHESFSSEILAISSFLTILVGIIILTKYKNFQVKLKKREGFLVALLSWVFVCILGAIPYLTAGEDFSFIDSIFESVAGWTTTGAWVIPINLMPKSILMWKATTNWLGGMGILVFTMSFLPTLGVGAKNLVSSETTGPELTKYSAKLNDSAKIAYLIYIVLSLIELILLLLDPKMGKFDALVNTMSTVSTAGIFDIGGEIAWSFSSYAKTIISIFSIIGAMNFSVYLFAVRRNFKRAYRSIEVKAYLSILSISSLLIFISLLISNQYTTIRAFGYSIAQSISFGSTSGFSVSDVSHWPSFAQTILVILIMIGGCSASTAGSLKVIRVVVFMKLILRGMYKRIHPHTIRPVMLKDEPVSPEMANGITVYISLYMGVLVLGTLILSLDNLDLTTTITAAIGSLSNNGSGLGDVSAGNFSIFSPIGKSVSAILMFLGRTELYAAILIFSKSFWRPDYSNI